MIFYWKKTEHLSAAKLGNSIASACLSKCLYIYSVCNIYIKIRGCISKRGKIFVVLLYKPVILKLLVHYGLKITEVSLLGSTDVRVNICVFPELSL